MMVADDVLKISQLASIAMLHVANLYCYLGLAINAFSLLYCVASW